MLNFIFAMILLFTNDPTPLKIAICLSVWFVFEFCHQRTTGKTFIFDPNPRP